MLYFVYDLPNAVFALIVVGAFVLYSLVGLVITRPFAAKHFAEFDDSNEMIGQFLSTMGVFFGITLGLISVGVWDTFNDVEGKVGREASSVAALYRDVKFYPEPVGSQLRAELKEYTRYVIEEAWPQQQQGAVPMGGTERISTFQKTLYEFSPVTDGQKILHAEAMSQFNELIQARRERLRSVKQGLPAAVWWVVVLGALLSIAVTWLFQMKRFALHITLTVALSSLLGLLVFLMAAMDNPYRGSYSVGPDAFKLVYESLMR
jgi:hypothetical protein